jgi:prepilin-type N-terminal cleavage/methylation domain-containing protein
MFIPEQAVMVKSKAFTLIEVLVAMIIMGILSSFGVIGYNNYTASVKDSATKSNYETINKLSESEFAKCKLNKNSKIFNNHDCKSSAPPSITQLDDYFTNSQKLKNPYDQKQKVIQNDICVAGGVTLKTTNTGVFETSYFSQKNNTKNTSNINSTWAQKFTDTTSTSVSFACTQTASASSSASSVTVGSFDSYKPPNSGAGAGIIVDRNGNMQDKISNGAMACGPDCFTANFDSWLKGGGLDPNQYKVVMAEGASSSGNVASACANKNCKYNFSDNTFTVLNSGKTYKAGESIDTIYSK